MRRHAPATDRNREPILEVLRKVLPTEGLVLEIASGTGQHAAYFSEQLSTVEWQPSDGDPSALVSIAAWSEDAGPRLLPPLHIDVASEVWPVEAVDAIFCANMIHIAPWTAAEGLFRGAGRRLAAGAPMVLYGPFRRAEVATAESNEGFDRSLKERDARWGIRDLADVTALADANGIDFETLYELPANNLAVIFRKRA